MAVAPVVTMSSTTSTSPATGDDPHAAGDVALPVGAGEADRVAGEGAQSQRLDDRDHRGPATAARRHAGDGVAAAAPGGPAAGRRGNEVSGGSRTPQVSRCSEPGVQGTASGWMRSARPCSLTATIASRRGPA